MIFRLAPWNSSTSELIVAHVEKSQKSRFDFRAYLKDEEKPRKLTISKSDEDLGARIVNWCKELPPGTSVLED